MQERSKIAQIMYDNAAEQGSVRVDFIYILCNGWREFIYAVLKYITARNINLNRDIK